MSKKPNTPPSTSLESRGGYRGTEAQARFTSQLVGLVTPATRARVIALTRTHRISQAKVLRAIIAAGIDTVEAELASGRVSADTMA